VGFPIPDHVGPYRVLRPIASGGTGEVYEVQDTVTGERYALKLLVAIESTLKRFNREYEAMARLNHPGIVRVYHYGMHEKHPWLTMEMLRGIPAQTYLKRVGRPGTRDRTHEVLRVGYHLARALQYIHDRGLVHRDLKSANVIILPDARVKLVDFGTARLLDAMEKITLDGEFVGTFAYASPEQLKAEAFDHRSDLYSLGVLLYRLATGKRPFNAKDPARLAYHVLHKQPPDPREYAPDLPQDLVDLLMKLMAKKASDRPQRAIHVAAALEAIRGKPFSPRSSLAVHTPASVSRDQEGKALWARLDEGLPGDLVMVIGDDGSDRSRFVEICYEQAAARDRIVFPCRWAGKRGHEAVIAMVRAVVEDVQDKRIEPAIAALDRLATPDAVARPSDRVTLRRVAAELFRIRAEKNPEPFTLLVPEVQRLGGPALELLGGVRRAMAAEGVRMSIVASCRAPEAEGDTEVVRHLGRGWTLELGGMEPREVAVAVGTMLGRRPPPAELARQIHAVTGGLPRYVEATVHELVKQGGIEAEGNRLEWAGTKIEIPVPPRAKQRAEDRLETLPVAQRRVLEAMVVLREAADLRLVSAALGWSSEEVMPLLRPLSEGGAVSMDAVEGNLRWRQPLLERAVAEHLSAPRRRTMHRLAAAAVEPADADASQLRVLLQAGRASSVIRRTVEVAGQLRAGAKLGLAIELLELLLADADNLDPDAVLVEAFLQYSECLQLARTTDPRAARALARASNMVRAEPALRARVELARARLFGGIGHYKNFRKHLDTAWKTLEGTKADSLASEVAVELARSHLWQGDITSAQKWSDLALERARSAADASGVGRAGLCAIACLVAQGSLEEAESWASQVMHEFQWSSDLSGFYVALATWAEVLRRQGRFSEALALLHERIAEASQSEERRAYVELLLSAARLEVDLRRLGRAAECMDELAAIIGKGEHLRLRLESQLVHGQIMLASGEPREASYVLSDVAERAKRAELILTAEKARALLGEATAAVGDTEESDRQYQSAMLGLMATGDVTALIDAVVSRGRATEGRIDPDVVFRPVDAILEMHPFVQARLERQLARASWARSHGNTPTSARMYREAARLLTAIRSSLNDTERAALRVHPWSRRLLAGLR
jgi:tetratricopeptide (TPR) repeat protein